MTAERETLIIALTSFKVCYTTFAAVGLCLNILSFLTAQRDLNMIRSTGRNGARLRMALMFRREEASLAVVLACIVAIGINSIITPILPAVETHSIITGIVTAIGWLVTVVVLSFNAVANYLGRRLILDKIDAMELNNLDEWQREKAARRMRAGAALELAQNEVNAANEAAKE